MDVQASSLVDVTGFPHILEIMENLENHWKKFHAWKIIEFEKTWINLEKSWNFVK